MLKELRSSWRARTVCVIGWVSIIWFTSVVRSSDVNHLSTGSFPHQLRVVKLKTSPQVVAQCGENVTLTCDVSSSSEMTIEKFAWMTAESKRLCELHNDKLDPEVLCESKVEPLNKYRLNLTLTNMMPANQGEYFCKFRSNSGTENGKTVVTLQECHGSFESSNNESHVVCWFHGVYPDGMVHWFQGSTNLTDSASTHKKEDQNGLYNVKSTLKIQPENMSQPYNCSLWIPVTKRYLSSQQLPMAVRSSGSMVTLQWVSIMVGALIVKIIM